MVDKAAVAENKAAEKKAAERAAAKATAAKAAAESVAQQARITNVADEPLELDVLGPMHRAARRWLRDVFVPMVTRLRTVLGEDADPVQGCCDFLEVKWLLSEEAGRDVGDAVAIARLAAHTAPAGSAAGMAVAEEPALLGPAGEVLLPPG